MTQHKAIPEMERKPVFIGDQPQLQSNFLTICGSVANWPHPLPAFSDTA